MPVLSGRHVLVVEDEPIVAMLLEDMLNDLGLGVAAFARTLPNAMKAAETCACDAAILDINLKGEMSYPAAEKLAQAGVPIVFVTGYARQQPPESLRHAQVLLKPYGIHELAGALHRALGDRIAA